LDNEHETFTFSPDTCKKWNDVVSKLNIPVPALRSLTYLYCYKVPADLNTDGDQFVLAKVGITSDLKTRISQEENAFLFKKPQVEVEQDGTPKGKDWIFVKQGFGDVYTETKLRQCFIQIGKVRCVADWKKLLQLKNKALGATELVLIPRQVFDKEELCNNWFRESQEQQTHDEFLCSMYDSAWQWKGKVKLGNVSIGGKRFDDLLTSNNKYWPCHPTQQKKVNLMKDSEEENEDSISSFENCIPSPVESVSSDEEESYETETGEI